jgi:DinB family protein
MDALGLFLQRYHAVHGGFVDDLFAGLTDGQVRARPHGLNSVAWLVWHATRVEDAAVNRFVTDRPQVLTEEGWLDRLGVARRDVGSGMPSADVDNLSAGIDTEALRGYARAVAGRTRAVAGSLAPGAWEEVVAADRIHHIVADEALLVDAGRWVEDFWARGHARGWYLLQTALLHPYAHWFEAMATRGQLGVPGR